ncbi:MAG: radical SAM protein [Deltaproteobacteria bacterium]|nr:radical SAM protein [Deltaproteobacteria bacterium]
MKVLVVSPNTKLFPDPVYPIGASYITTACRNAGHEVEAFDYNFKADPKADLAALLRTFAPDVVGISIRNVDNALKGESVSFFPVIRDLVAHVRSNCDATIILGGSGYSLFPVEFLDYTGADHGVVGSGEEAMVQFLRDLEAGTAVKRVINSSKPDKDVAHTVPDRGFFDFEKYYGIGGLLGVQSQRGCTFNCSYCTYPNLEGRMLVPRQPGVVVDEIEGLIRDFKARHFFFVDSVFNHKESHVFAICDEIIRRGLSIKWSAYVRPRFKDPDLIPTMKAAGCKSIELGTDSLAEPTMKSMNKAFTVDDVFRFSEKCSQSGILFCQNLIFGAPGETRDTVETSIRNVLATEPTAVLGMLGIRIYPNTMIADYLVESGYLKDQGEIGLEPIFYVDEAVKDWIADYLVDLESRNKLFIFPGLTTPKNPFGRRLLRLLTRQGLLWEAVRYRTMGPRLKARIIKRTRGLLGMR